MIEISDLNALSSMCDELGSLINIHSENWDDCVFDRIHKEHIDPMSSRMQQVASSAEPDIHQIVNIHNEMIMIASRY